MDSQDKLVNLLIENLFYIERTDTKIYHYTSLAGLKSIIDNMTLRFTNVRFLNDISERKEIYEMYEKCCESLKSEGNKDFIRFIEKIAAIDFDKNRDDFIIGVEEQYQIKREPADIFVLCFSKDSDSLPMWNYYSKNPQSKGYNLELNTSIFLAINSKVRSNIEICSGEVKYDDEEKMRYLKSFIHKLYDIFERSEKKEEEQNSIENSIKAILNRKSLFFKSHYFQHENEYRFVVSVSRKLLTKEIILENPEIKYAFREGDGILIPYLSVKFNVESGKAPTICIGPLIDKDLASVALNNYLLTKENAFRHADIIQSQIPVRY